MKCPNDLIQCRELVSGLANYKMQSPADDMSEGRPDSTRHTQESWTVFQQVVVELSNFQKQILFLGDVVFES